MRSYPNWPEYLMIRDTGLHDDQGGLGQRIYTTAGAGYKKVRYVREDLASAPAPASGGVDAGRVTLFSALEAAYIRGAAWCAEMGMTHTFSELRKAAYDYADKEEKDVICREVRASLSPAATPVSEAVCNVVPPPETYGGSPNDPWTGKLSEAGDEGREFDQAVGTIEARNAELSDISAAIGSTRFMDPPDGGDVPFAEQVRRMREALEEAERALGTAVGWAAVYDHDLKHVCRTREECLAVASNFQAIHPVHLGPAWRHQED